MSTQVINARAQAAQGVITLSPPAAGDQYVFQALDGLKVALGFPADGATMAQDGQNLTFSFPDGGQIVLTDFFAQYGTGAAPSFIVEGQELPGDAFLTAFNADLLPAAGPAGGGGAGSGGVGDYQSDPGALINTVDRLGALDPSQFPEGVPQVVLLENGLVDNGVTIIDLTSGGPGLGIGEGQVFESGLGNRTGDQPIESPGTLSGIAATSMTGDFTVLAPDGLATVTIGGITVISGGALVANPVVTGPGFLGTLTITGYNAATGQITYKYELKDNADHTAGDDSVRETFTVTATDTDGDSATGSLTLKIVDDAPTIGADNGVKVDESFYLFSNVAEGDTGNSIWQGHSLHKEGALSFKAGADGVKSIVFDPAIAAEVTNLKTVAESTTTPPHLTSQGYKIHYELSDDGHTLTGYIEQPVPGIAPSDGPSAAIFESPHVTVFTMHIDNSGHYTYTQYRPLDHAQDGPSPADHDDPLSFNIGVIVTDNDSDKAYGDIKVTVEDAGPFVIPSVAMVDESAFDHHNRLETARAMNVDPKDGEQQQDIWGNGYIHTSGKLAYFAGADGVGDFTLHTPSEQLTSQGEKVSFTVLPGGHTLIGYVGEVAPTGNLSTASNIVMVATIDKNGHYEYTQYRPLDHSVDGLYPPATATKSLGFTPNPHDDALTVKIGVTITDGDGDTASSKIIVFIKDDGPTIRSTDPIVVDETNYDQSHHSSRDVDNVLTFSGDLEHSNSGTPSHGTQDLWGNGKLHKVGDIKFDAGADGLKSIALSAPVTNLKSEGSEVHFSLSPDGHTLIGYVGGTVPTGYHLDQNPNLVMVITIDKNGHYEYTQYRPLDHATPTDHNDPLKFNVDVTITDGDGDTAKANIGITVKDDGPTIRSTDPIVVDETSYDQSHHSSGDVDKAFAFGRDQEHPDSGKPSHDTRDLWGNGKIHDDGDIRFDAGADGLKSIALSAPVTNLKSEGSEVHFSLSPDGHTLIGYVGGTVPTGYHLDQNPNLVMVITIDKNGHYEYTQYRPLDHETPTDHNDSLAFNVGVTIIDGDGDTAKTNIGITVKDDGPEKATSDDNVEHHRLDSLHIDFGKTNISSNIFVGNKELTGSSISDPTTGNDGWITDRVQMQVNGGTPFFSASGLGVTYDGKAVNTATDGPDRENEIGYRDEHIDGNVVHAAKQEGIVFELNGLANSFKLDASGAFFDKNSTYKEGELGEVKFYLGSTEVAVGKGTFDKGTFTLTPGNQLFDRVVIVPTDIDDKKTAGDNSDFYIKSVDFDFVSQVGKAEGTITPNYGADGKGDLTFGTLSTEIYTYDGHKVTMAPTGDGHMLKGTYGTQSDVAFTISINPDTGKWNFEQKIPLDIDNSLKSKLTFNVTIKDGDGDTAPGTITVGITEHERAPDVDTGLSPHVVFEAGLNPLHAVESDNTPPATASITGTFVINTAGEVLTEVSIAGHVFSGTQTPDGYSIPDLINETIKLNAHGLEAKDGDPVHATLTINDYSAGKVSYTYTLTDNVFHGDTIAGETFDKDKTGDIIPIKVTTAGGTADATLTVTIVDDVPSFAHVSASTDANRLTGSEERNATGSFDLAYGADGNAAPHALTVTYGTTTVDVASGSPISIAGGTLTVTAGAGGHYTYTFDAGSATKAGSNQFTFKATDGDGDTTPQNVTINVANTPPVAIDDAFYDEIKTSTLNVNTDNAIITVHHKTALRGSVGGDKDDGLYTLKTGTADITSSGSPTGREVSVSNSMNGKSDDEFLNRFFHASSGTDVTLQYLKSIAYVFDAQGKKFQDLVDAAEHAQTIGKILYVEHSSAISLSNGVHTLNVGTAIFDGNFSHQSQLTINGFMYVTGNVTQGGALEVNGGMAVAGNWTGNGNITGADGYDSSLLVDGSFAGRQFTIPFKDLLNGSHSVAGNPDHDTDTSLPVTIDPHSIALSSAGYEIVSTHNDQIIIKATANYTGDPQFTYTVVDSDGAHSAPATVAIHLVTFSQGDCGSNTLTGGNSYDIIAGNGGQDTIAGGAGNDILFGDAAYTPRGLSGASQLYSYIDQNHDTVSNKVDPSGAADTIHGNDGHDIIYGQGGDDQLYGDAGDDHLYGGAGNDYLDGGMGKNYLHGGSGDDTLVIRDTTSDGTITDADFLGMHGGSGVDTLKLMSNLDSHGTPQRVTLDFTKIADGKVTGFEKIDLTSTGSQNLILDKAAVLDLEDNAPRHEIMILGTSADSVKFVQTAPADFVKGADVVKDVGGAHVTFNDYKVMDGTTEVHVLVQQEIIKSGA